ELNNLIDLNIVVFDKPCFLNSLLKALRYRLRSINSPTLFIQFTIENLIIINMVIVQFLIILIQNSIYNKFINIIRLIIVNCIVYIYMFFLNPNIFIMISKFYFLLVWNNIF